MYIKQFLEDVINEPFLVLIILLGITPFILVIYALLTGQDMQGMSDEDFIFWQMMMQSTGAF